jgi:hypothetical protein
MNKIASAGQCPVEAINSPSRLAPVWPIKMRLGLTLHIAPTIALQPLRCAAVHVRHTVLLSQRRNILLLDAN